MSRSPTFLELARERVVIYDGATGTNLQLRDLGPDDFGGEIYEGCNEMLCLTRPDVVQDLHRSFFEVGVDVVETNSFGRFPSCSPSTGSPTGPRSSPASRRPRRRRGAQLLDARPPRYVAGSIGPGTKLPTLGQIGFTDLRDSYQVLAGGLLAGGVDLLLVETSYDTLQAKAAIQACRRAMAAAGRQVPIQVQVTIELTGRMLLGTEIGAALCALEAMSPDVIGLNCATGPVEMREPLRHLSDHALTLVSALPNAGLPSVVDGRMHYDLGPEELARHLANFVVRARCGRDRRVLRHDARAPPPSRRGLRRYHPRPTRAGERARSGFAVRAVPFEQELSFLVIGERTNANGSRAFREAMLAKDWDTTVAMARDQVREGAHLLDVCVDYTGADGVADMTELVSRLAGQSTIPLVIDSTEPAVIEAALSGLAAGRCSTRSTSRTETLPAHASTASSRSPRSTARLSSAPASTPKARHARPTGSCGRRRRSTTSPSIATASGPGSAL